MTVEQLVNGPTVSQAAQPEPATTAQRKRSARKSKTNGHAATTATDTNSRTIAITLPKEVVDWYDQQASQAPYEPSTQKYIAWQLRQFAQAQQRQLEMNEQVVGGISESRSGGLEGL